MTVDRVLNNVDLDTFAFDVVESSTSISLFKSDGSHSSLRIDEIGFYKLPNSFGGCEGPFSVDITVKVLPTST